MKFQREIEIKEDFLTLRKDNPIKPRMRKILIDWLVQVHSRFHLLQETLYITVSIIDRFLEVKVFYIEITCLKLFKFCIRRPA